MKIEEINIENLKLAPYNPRIVSPEFTERLKKSIKEYEAYSPLIANKKTSHVVGGNQRLLALKELGHKTVFVVWVDLGLEKEKLLNIQLNQLMSDWDFPKLSELLAELTKFPDIEITDTGFDLLEISQIFDRYSDHPGEDDFDFEAAVNSISEPVSKPGDIISLGLHRIMCADATDPLNIEKLFGNEMASLYISDWPYGVNYDAGNRPGAKKSKWLPIKNDDLNEVDFIKWMGNVISVTVPKLKAGAALYIWNGHNKFGSMTQLCEEFDIHPACIITWAKPSFSPGWCDYQHQTEFCLYGWKNDGPHSWYGKAESTLWEVNRDPSNSLVHSTQKPIQLSQRAICNSSQKGEILYDSCLGSGSALIAAESLGRRCFGCEIEPIYCDAIIRRWVNYVGRENVPAEIIEKYFSKEVFNDRK